MIPVSTSLAKGAQIVAGIEQRSGARVSDCYQCGRCTSTCAGAFAFDIPPHRILRLLQLGEVEKVLNSATAQLCLDCMTCSMRCPMNIDVASVIESAKMMAEEMRLKDTEKGMRVFRREFLQNVRRHGRLHEPSLMGWINMKTGRPFNDFSLLPLVLRKKKVHMVPPRIKNLRHLRRLFREVGSFNGANGAVAVHAVHSPEEACPSEVNRSSEVVRPPAAGREAP